ncbi:uncharacterized protein J3D65DRAFT_218797 [Phyllosticta citribraziliensis]|uniref:Uncharacterized protein n=1 Tax=Phyllosticta citribraziliensis TaxID=989973 RepID=A0ABR1M4J9_9PEZI
MRYKKAHGVVGSLSRSGGAVSFSSTGDPTIDLARKQVGEHRHVQSPWVNTRMEGPALQHHFLNPITRLIFPLIPNRKHCQKPTPPSYLSPFLPASVGNEVIRPSTSRARGTQSTSQSRASIPAGPSLELTDPLARQQKPMTQRQLLTPTKHMQIYNATPCAPRQSSYVTTQALRTYALWRHRVHLSLPRISSRASQPAWMAVCGLGCVRKLGGCWLHVHCWTGDQPLNKSSRCVCSLIWEVRKCSPKCVEAALVACPL